MAWADTNNSKTSKLDGFDEGFGFRVYVLGFRGFGACVNLPTDSLLAANLKPIPKP